jgi:hypothetical protein
MHQTLSNALQRFYEAVKYGERLAWAALWLGVALFTIAIVLLIISDLLDEDEKSF